MPILNNRPKDLDSFFGQTEIKNNLRVFINSALERESTLDHCLFFGPPGLGKTSLAMVVGKEMGVKTHIISSPSIEKITDIVPLLASMESGEVLFLDEIHRLPIAVEEILYSAMEDFKIDILLESGAERKVLTLELEPFTLIGATTRSGLISKPMKDRFSIQFSMEEYSNEDLGLIVSALGENNDMPIDQDASILLASSSRFTPRIAIGLYNRSRDFALFDSESSISIETVQLCLSRMGIDNRGLNKLDMEYVSILSRKNKPVGIKTLSTLLNQDIKTIEDDIEPFLLRLDIIEKTNSGRILVQGE